MDNTKDSQPPAIPPFAASNGSATGGMYPATLIVHTPSGPVAACESHAAKIKALMSFMGAHTNATTAPEWAECPNCKNEAKLPNDKLSDRRENNP